MRKQHATSSIDHFEVSASCEEAICRLVQQRTGIVIQDHQLKKLQQTLQDACQRFNYHNANQYLQALLDDNGLSSEFEYLIGGITVGESYFFRDESQMAFLRDVYFPQLITSRRQEGNLSLRVWSAGCSAGQELYSITIMLHEMLPDISDWQLHLLGTDINTDALTLAIKARYSEWSMRALNNWQKQRYFKRVREHYELDRTIRDSARFAYLNLSDDSYPSILNETHALDLILCRNVLIYLQRPVIDSIVEKMRNCLCNDGIIMLGATDTFTITVPELTLYNHDFIHYYRKAAADSSLIPLQHDPVADKASTDTGLPDTPSHVKSAKPQPAAAADNIPEQPFDIASAIELIRQQQWQELVNKTTLIDITTNSLLLQFRAKALANLGQLEEAAECCVQSLTIDSTDKHSYFIYGLVLLELDQISEAEQAFNRTLYLDRFFVEAYYQLGMLMVRSGRLHAGIKQLENALREAERNNQEQYIHDTAGMTYQRFAQILRNEISMYKELFQSTP